MNRYDITVLLLCLAAALVKQLTALLCMVTSSIVLLCLLRLEMLFTGELDVNSTMLLQLIGVVFACCSIV